MVNCRMRSLQNNVNKRNINFQYTLKYKKNHFLFHSQWHSTDQQVKCVIGWNSTIASQSLRHVMSRTALVSNRRKSFEYKLSCPINWRYSLPGAVLSRKSGNFINTFLTKEDKLEANFSGTVNELLYTLSGRVLINEYKSLSRAVSMYS